MHDYYTKVIKYFGEDWFNNQFEEFLTNRQKYPKDGLNKEIVELEIKLHPLVMDVIRPQATDAKKIKWDDVKKSVVANYEIMHLGRDLSLLESEIKARGDKIRVDLINPLRYENHRFNIFVASGYKLLGYEVTFVPSSSKKGKTPDLYVTKRNKSFYIECKQRDQRMADVKRFTYLAKIAEQIFLILRSKRINICFIDFRITKDNITDELYKLLVKKIYRNDLKSFVFNKEISINIRSVTTLPYLVNLLKNNGHYDEKIVFTTFEDGFIASDPLTTNTIYINKSGSDRTVPLGIYDLLLDANNKNKDGEKLLTYLDFGKADSIISEKLAFEIKEKLKKGYDPYPNIDGLFILQTIRKILEDRQVIIKPNVFAVAKKSKLGSDPIALELFGLQGSTGIDKYLLPIDFLESGRG